MTPQEHAMLSDLEATARHGAAETDEDHLAAEWAREGDRRRHETRLPARSAVRREGPRRLA